MEARPREGLWDTFIRTDTELVTKKKLEDNAKNLDYFDAVYFYTTGELAMDDSQKADLLSFIKEDGKGFMGGHSAIDTFYKWPEYGEMMRLLRPASLGDFRRPASSWKTRSSRACSICRLPSRFATRFISRRISRGQSARADAAGCQQTGPDQSEVHRTDRDFPVIWVRDYGKGRVMYNGLGHVEAVWDRPDIQKMWVDLMKWSFGLLPGDATPPAKPGAPASD